MAFALGYIDSAALNNIKSFHSVKEDQLEDENIQASRGGDNGLFISQKSAKAEISLDMDFIEDTEYGNLRKIMLNRKYPNKIYIREPGLVSGGILIPTHANNLAYKLKNNLALPILTSLTATEFTTGDYTNITGFSTPMSYSASVNEYLHYLFTFDLTTFLTSVSLDNLLRLTLFMQTPAAYRVPASGPTDKYGIIVHAYNFSQSTLLSTAVWTEIYRRSITLQSTNQQAAGLRPITGYTSIQNYVDISGATLGQNYVAFMVSILQPRNGAGTIYLDSNYVALFCNGFMVRMTDNFNLNWREEITIVGRTGNLKLSEV